ncbi:MAG: class I SAM-dependent methyltransferase [Candidatus Shapirobacteria bacterium]|jgi:cyclopropane fatty-acyl-phospholipid synthase-like methyltransferase
MKQVNPKYYDQKYFKIQSISPDFSQKLNPSCFYKKYKEMASMLKIKSIDSICDYGCGTGDLSFLLYLKFKCSIIALDYSSDAIKICQSKLKLFKKNTDAKNNIKFLNKDNKNIPKLKNIKAVYFCDVFEHLYPSEINFIFNKISEWGNPNIIIHTDNNIYLKYIEPITHLIALILRKTSFKKLKQEKSFQQKRHINLTNPKKLTQTMAKLEYKLVKTKYPKLDKKTIKIQLGNLSKFKLLINLSFFLLKLFPFLSPSFYALYSKNRISL